MPPTLPLPAGAVPARPPAARPVHWPVLFGPPLLVLALAVGVLYGIAQVRVARGWVAHTRDVLDAAAQVQTAVLDLELARHGEVTGPAPAALPPGAAAEAGVARIRTLTVDDPAQQARAARLATLVAALEAAPGGAGRLGAVRDDIAAVRADELRRLAERQAREDRLAGRTRAGVVLGALAAALLAALTNATLARYARRQAALAGELAGHNEQLQQQAAELEVQQLTLQEQAGELEAQNEELQQQSAELEQQQEQMQEQAVELEAQAQQRVEQNVDLERTAARLTESEAHARELADTVPSGLVESDAAGRFVWANRAAAEILRLPREEIAARDYRAPAWQTVTLDGAPLAPDALPVGRALATGAPVRAFEHAIVDPATGARVALRVNVSPLRDAEGRVTGALSAFDDVTAELHAQARLRRVEESGVVGLFSWTLSGGITEANDAFLGMLGYTRADLSAGRVDWRRMTPPEYAAQDDAAVAELMAAGMHGPIRKAYVGADGRPVPIVLASAFLPGSREEGVCVCLDLRALADVEAAERRAREGAERLQAVTAGFSGALTPAEVAEVLAARGAGAAGARAAAVALLVVDEDAPDARPNAATGWVPNDARLELIAASGLGEAERAAWERVPLGAPVPLAEAARTGRAAWLPPGAGPGGAPDPAGRAWCVLPLAARALGTDGGPADGGEAPRVLGAVALAFDAAPPGDAPFDDARRRFLASLADQAGQALERARLYREARAGNEAKSGFMATMSHELRTPLNALIGYSELLLMGVPDAIPPGAQAQVARMRTAARHLLGLIEEILLHARLEAGRVAARPERVDVGALVDEVRTVVEPLAQAKGLTLTVDAGAAPAAFDTDPGKLRQILINLAGNAVKFTDRGGVAVRAAAGDGRVTFAVEDTGVGIAREHLERVFEPFWQVAQHQGAQRPAGTGLGLSVTRRLARLLGGDVAVESAPGVGSRFTVWLPGGGDEA